MIRAARAAVPVLAALFTTSLVSAAYAEDAAGSVPRARQTINDCWRFLPDDLSRAADPKFDDMQWKIVNVPHTWNSEDPFDDEPGYRRAASWYRKKLHIGPELKGKRLFLFFEGVHQLAEVFVEGKPAGRHLGGYTAFSCEITDLVKFGDAGADPLIAVKADNSHNEAIAPLDIGYAFYGGIYRDVWLVATEPVHLDMLDHASSGVYIDTPQVSAESGTVRVRATVVNQSASEAEIIVASTLFEPQGKQVARGESKVKLSAGKQGAIEATTEAIAKPQLWSPDHPNLYVVETVLLQGDKVVDRIRTPIGFRWYKFDPEKGFFLNGEHLKLRGASRHQDFQGLGSALPNSMHRTDLQWLKDMGGNFLRLAHYPQDPVALQTADEIGLLVWEEIPIVSTSNGTPEFRDACRGMLQDMIRQHYNHPSVIVWGYMNEVLLHWGRTKDKSPKFIEEVQALARNLEDLARKEDPTRVTVMAMDASDRYNQYGLADIPMVSAWNIYQGWYGGTFEGFGRFMDDQHKRFPNRPIIVSEYGAGSDERLHSLKPERFDHTSEWMMMFHESHLKQIEERPFLAGTLIWNQFDFSQPEAHDTIPHVNQKGMLTWDRRPKDVYYFYQANLKKDPVLHIATREWSHRSGTNPDAQPGAGKQPVTQPVRVYSNLAEVELFLNGKSLGAKKPDAMKCLTWDVPFVDGTNLLEAKATKDGREYRDQVSVQFTYYAPRLADPSVPFKELAVNLGANQQFIDGGGLVWLADQKYTEGGFGYLEGKDLKTTREIFGTDDDPLYQWFLRAVRTYRFDVPDGDYELELRFIEYARHKPGERVFNVRANGQRLIDKLDLTAQYGERRAVARTFGVRATGGQGVAIKFEPVSGEPLISAIRIRKLP